MVDKLFPIGTKIAKFLLPEEGIIEVGKYRMIINPKEDLGLYFGYESVEPEVIYTLKRLLREGDIFFDVGAYKGYYSLLASELVGERGKVIAFEPYKEAFEILLKNIRLNGITNIIAENVALSDFEGAGKFVPAGIGSHLGNGNQIIKVKTLDNVVNTLKIVPDIIKIDVEGAEYSVLRGAKNVLKHYRPTLIIEIHRSADFQLFNYLTSLGYNIGLLNKCRILWLDLEEIKRKCVERHSTEWGTRINYHIYCE